MPNPISSRTAFTSLLGVLALAVTAEAQRPSQGRPSGGGGSVSRPSAPSVSRPSVSRPSAPSVSRPSAPSVSRPAPSSYSRPTPSPTYQRGGSSQRGSAAPAPQPRYEQPSAPRSEQPSAPRYEQPNAPRYEQPSAPRYEQPGAPRYDAPSDRASGAGSRYGGSRDVGGRVYEEGSGDRGGLSNGRIDPARIERNTPTPYQPRVWQPDGVVDLSGAVRPPRVRVPSISGSRSGIEGGLSSGRLARAGLDTTRPSAATPRPEVSGDSLRARYGAAEPTSSGRVPSADAVRADGASSIRQSPGLSGGRNGGTGRVETPARSRVTEANGRADARSRPLAPQGRGADARTRSDGVNGRVADGMRRAGEVERTSPEVGHRLRAAGNAAHAAGTIAGGIVIGTGAGFYGGARWGNDVWNDCGWYWNSCWNGGWWWSFSYGWPYGSCWWGWPGYSSYWGYGSSYWGWGYSPWIYRTVVYETYAPEVIVVQQPAPEAEFVPAAPAAGALPQVAPEVRAGLEASADESLLAGDAAFREARYSDAVRHYARAVEFSPERGSLWLILSDALFATGDYHYAAYAFRRALELDATLLETIVDKHAWYSDPAEFDRHIAWSEAYLRDHVLDEDARLILAANYLFAKRFASASDVLESAFGAGLVETPAGKLVLERSRRALGYSAK